MIDLIGLSHASRIGINPFHSDKKPEVKESKPVKDSKVAKSNNNGKTDLSA